jgi:hypothetical protein
VRTSGVLPSSAWPEVVLRAGDEGRNWSCLRFLVDHRSVQFQFRFADIWRLPRNAGRFKMDRESRVALLLPLPHAAKKTFIEAFVANRGFNLKIFDDEVMAITWLREPSKPNPLAFT